MDPASSICLFYFFFEGGGGEVDSDVLHVEINKAREERGFTGSGFGKEKKPF